MIALSQNVKREAFIQRSVTPCQRVPTRHFLSEFPEFFFNDLFGTCAYRTQRPVPKIHVLL